MQKLEVAAMCIALPRPGCPPDLSCGHDRTPFPADYTTNYTTMLSYARKI